MCVNLLCSLIFIILWQPDDTGSIIYRSLQAVSHVKYAAKKHVDIGSLTRIWVSQFIFHLQSEFSKVLPLN